jgi:hypothetical protein
MNFERIFYWLFFPFVMVFVDWKRINKFLKIYGLFTVFIACFIIIAIATVDPSTLEESNKQVEKKSEKPKVLTEAEKEKKRIEQYETCFSPWDGSHTKLKYFIKDNMNDPGSFDHVETTYQDMVTVLIVQTTFRGNNQFGALVKNTIKARVSADDQCTILKILSQR